MVSFHCLDYAQEFRRRIPSPEVLPARLTEQCSILLFRAFPSSRGTHHMDIKELRKTRGVRSRHNELGSKRSRMRRGGQAHVAEDLNTFRVILVVQNVLEEIHVCCWDFSKHITSYIRASPISLWSPTSNLSDRRWERPLLEAYVLPATHKLNRIASVCCEALSAPKCQNSGHSSMDSPSLIDFSRSPLSLERLPVRCDL
jgi:hypothetical protein